MAATNENQSLKLFYTISVFALVWNLLGVSQYLAFVYAPETGVETAPAYITAAFALAVFAGTLGSILLLLKKKLSNLFFWISFLGVAVQTTYNVLIRRETNVEGVTEMILPLVLIIISTYLIYFSHKSFKNGILS